MAFDANDLSPHEHFVAERTRSGEIADFTPLGAADGGKPSIRAGFLRRLLLSLDPSWLVRSSGVRLRGVRIEGALDLTDCSGLPGLSLDACDLPEPVDMTRAALVRLAFTGCRMRALTAAGAQIAGDLDLSGTEPLGAPGAEMLLVDARGARIGGEARFSSAKLARGEMETHALMLDGAVIGTDLRFDDGFDAFGAVTLTRARIGGSLLCISANLLHRGDDAKSVALSARAAEIGGDVRLGGLKAEGVVDLGASRIGGDLDLAGAVLRNEFGAALVLETAHIAGKLCGALKAAGQVQAQGAEIRGNLDLRAAELAHPLTPRGDTFGAAFDAPGLSVGGALLLQGVNIKGELVLTDARIAGYAAFGGGRFINGAAWAIRASNLHVGGNLTFKIDEGGFAPHGQKTVIEGGAKFDRARIDGALGWLNLELRGPGADGAKGAVFSFACAVIGGPLQAHGFVTHQHARLDASGARCAGLDDDAKTGWGLESTALDLEGFAYGRIANVDDTRRTRLGWLRRMQRFSPQPYTHLACAYALAGRREDARRVLLAQHDAQTARVNSGPLTWALSSLFGAIAGYGLAPLRLVRALALFLALGIAGVFAMNAQGALVTPAGQACNGSVEPALYAIDVAMPVIDLGQTDACAPGRTARAELPQGMLLGDSDWRALEGVALWRWAHALYAMLGAILAALAVLTFSGVMKPKED